MVIFLSSAISWILSFLIEDWDEVCASVMVSADGDSDDDIDGVNISAIHFFERLAILVRYS
jgi:hypothetical protein